MREGVPVWDPFVRIFHWSVAVAFIACRLATEGGDPPHEWLGYGAAALVGLRVGWGFVGQGAARWSDFWPTPSRLATQLREMLAGRPHARLGHSPIGAVVMIGMMAGLVGLAATGYAMEEIDYFWGDERMLAVHEWLSDAVLVLAVIHVCAALVQSIWLRENLPLSMITGRRRAR